jgi:hypothetical protein
VEDESLQLKSYFSEKTKIRTLVIETSLYSFQSGSSGFSGSPLDFGYTDGFQRLHVDCVCGGFAGLCALIDRWDSAAIEIPFIARRLEQ